MKLLNEKELALSAVVANINMNRGRNARGVNSYEKDIKLDPVNFLMQRINEEGRCNWLDLCCGEGRALIQTATTLHENKLQQKAELTGIDLVDYFAPVPSYIHCLKFVVMPVSEWGGMGQYDLVTCVHGLHYAGDKLTILQRAIGGLKNNGLFVANFDINSIHINNIDSKKYLQHIFSTNSIHYNARSRIISCIGPKEIEFGANYLGASDMAGPNYTGQEAVDAYYALR